MNYKTCNFVLAAALLLFPLAGFGQAVKEPGAFDPQTERAHSETANETETALPALPGLESQAVKPTGKVVLPDSSVVRPEDTGLRAHTNTLIFVPSASGAPNALVSGSVTTNLTPLAQASPAYTFSENPGSLACVDGLISYTGCTYSGGFYQHPTGGSGAIAIVDAYNNPYAASDLVTFDAEWGLPAANFTQIYCQSYPGTCYSTNSAPANNTGWGLEESLDIEYAHAMAPSAKIFLVEAASNSFADLTWANAWAAYYVDINGGGEVSNSWGGSEFSSETSYDYIFNNYSGNYHPVVFLASGGDSGTIEYPSASPYVISAGGTTINRDSSGNYLSQTCWSGTGRGTSAYESIPGFQSYVGGLTGTKRLTNDISSDADPASGVWVYDQFNGGWFVVGGTSVASPTLAGIFNHAGNFFNATQNEGSLIYSELHGKVTFPSYFTDVSPAGWDNCTGVGVPRSTVGE